MPLVVDVPEWKPLDLSGLAQIPQLYQAAKNATAQRKHTENEDRKISHDMARQDWEDQHRLDEEQRTQAITDSAELLPGSETMRAFHISPELGMAVGKTHGVGFDSTTSKPVIPAQDAEPHVSPAEAAQFIQGGAQVQQPPLQGPTPSGEPLTENTSLLDFKPPTMEPETSPDEPAAPVAPKLDVDKATASREAALPETKHWNASFRGQRFPVSDAAPSNYFDEPQYNQMFEKLTANGFSDKDAFTKVEALRKADIGELGKTNRFTASLGQKENTQLTREERMAEDAAARANALRIGQGRDNAIVTAAGERNPGMGGGGGAPIDPKVYNAYLATLKEVKGGPIFRAAVANRELFDRIGTETDALQSSNAILQKTAIHSLAALSVAVGSSAGVRVPVQVINDINNANGLIDSTKNKIYQSLNHGQNDPAIMEVVRGAAARLKAVSDQHKRQLMHAIEQQAGPGSAFVQREPGLLPDAVGAINAARSELGLPSLEEEQGQGEGQGAPAPMAPPPAAPGPRAHHTKKVAPAAPAQSGMVSITNKKTGETKMVTHDEAVRMGAVQP